MQSWYFITLLKIPILDLFNGPILLQRLWFVSENLLKATKELGAVWPDE